MNTNSRTSTTPYDVAEHLRTPEEMAAYLDAWFEEAPEDSAGIAKALASVARARGITHAKEQTEGDSLCQRCISKEPS